MCAIPDGAGLEEFFGRFGFAEWGRRPGWIDGCSADGRTGRGRVGSRAMTEHRDPEPAGSSTCRTSSPTAW